MSEFVDVTGVRVLHGHVLQLTFSTGEVRVLDVAPHLWGEAFRPVAEDYDLFTAVRVDPELGTIVWPNGADLASQMLYAESHRPDDVPADDGMTRDQVRSLLLGYATAGRVVADPTGARSLARENLRRMRATAARGATRRWFDEWQRLLDGPLLELLETLTSPSRLSCELRQTTPFAGLLSESERQQVLEVFGRLDAAELSGRFRRLPPMDPHRLRADVDAIVDQGLPGNDEPPGGVLPGRPMPAPGRSGTPPRNG